jgi:uncharacterized protein
MILSDCYLACITGATSELGSALAYLLSKKGIPLMLTGRNKEKLERLAKTLPDSKTLIANLATQNGRDLVVGWINKWKPNLIINNAGIGLYGPALDHLIEEQMEILTVNATAPIEITLGAVEMLQDEKRYGVVLNISSSAGAFPYPYFATYAASKRCLTDMSQSLDFEVRNDQIRVLAACPGQIRTSFRKNASKGRSLAHSTLSMSPLVAAKKLLRQVEKETPVYTFGALTKLGLFLLRLFPKKTRMTLLKLTVSQR